MRAVFFKSICLVFFVCAVFVSAHGQTLVLEVSNDSILIGNHFSVRFKMENVAGEFKTPEFEKMEIISGPNVSSSFSSINGEVTSSKSYTYIVKPLEEGQFVIHPGFAEHEGEELMTEPATIFVYPNPENIKQDNRFQDENNFFFSVPFDMPAMPKTKEKKKAKPKLKRI